MQHSIRFRLKRALLQSILAPLLLCGALLIWQSYVTQLTQALQLQRMVAQLAVTHVTDFITQLENELRVTIQMQDFVIQGYNARFDTLSKLLLSNPIYTQLTLLHGTGRELVSVSRTVAITPADLDHRLYAEEFLQPAQSGKTYFGPVVIDETTGEPLMTISVPVISARTGTVAYVLVANIRLRQVWEEIDGIDVGPHGSIYIVDQQGRLLAHRNPSLVLRGQHITLPITDGIQGSLAEWFNLLVSRTFILGTQQLTVITERPLTEAMPLAVGLILAVLLYLIVNILALFQLERMAIWLVVQPIETLAKTVHAITAGDLTQRAVVNTNTEIGDFAQAFNTMTAALQQSLGELEQHRDGLEALVAERTTELRQINQQLEEQINERKEVEADLRESEERFRTIAEATPVPLFIARKADGIIRYANLRFCAYQGLSVEALMGQPVYDLFPDTQNVGMLLEKLELEGAVHEFEMQGRHHLTGQKSWHSISIEFINFNRESAFFAAFHDITARKQAEHALIEKADELARSNTELERFAYVASHDLQEPLRMVSSYVQLLAQRYREQLDTDADEFIEYAVDGTRRMQVLINDLLAYSRVSTRGKTFTLTDCEEVFQQVMASLEIAIEERNATIYHEPLPTLLADHMQMVQLFQNLLGNAIKFSDTEAPIIQIRVCRQANEWLFAVQDNGIGLEPQFAERIFIIFQRLHSKADYPGTGIGLAICKKIVERHGGRIWVESELGQGATFYFTLPVSQPAEAL
ncbi:MAG: PAS domain S-box protein [Caldilineaceae bacterium]|nr:PAS domain S-box protein [Caldilineaceae bacterium]